MEFGMKHNPPCVFTEESKNLKCPETCAFHSTLKPAFDSEAEGRGLTPEQFSNRLDNGRPERESEVLRKTRYPVSKEFANTVCYQLKQGN